MMSDEGFYEAKIQELEEQVKELNLIIGDLNDENNRLNLIISELQEDIYDLKVNYDGE